MNESQIIVWTQKHFINKVNEENYIYCNLTLSNVYFLWIPKWIHRIIATFNNSISIINTATKNN